MKQKALIVDDSTVTRMMVKKILTDRDPNWEFVEAESADKAFSLLGGLEELTLATIDQNMPGEKTGLDFAEELKKKFSNLKIALITANIQDAIRKRADQIGIKFVEKPISADKMKALLDSN